jgi:glucose-1-phosphate thymidylyltransferase
VGPLIDLVALGAEWAVPTLVSVETHRDATSVQFPGRAGVLPGFQRFDPCDWGLGVEIRGHKHPTGPDRPIRRAHTGTSAAAGPSCGWIRRPVWSAPDAAIGPSGRGRCGPGPSSPTPSCPNWPPGAQQGRGRGRPRCRSDFTSRLRPMKGVILAGGTGTRLHPLTRITNKHLLPIYDRPMISYAIEALVKAGITEIMVVTGGTHAGEFLRLLGNGHEFGIDRLQLRLPGPAGGIAEALGLAELNSSADEPVLVMLADNIVERTFGPRSSGSVSRVGGADAPHRGLRSRSPSPSRRPRVRRERERSCGSSRSPRIRRVLRVTGIYCYDPTSSR